MFVIRRGYVTFWVWSWLFLKPSTLMFTMETAARGLSDPENPARGGQMYACTASLIAT